MKRERGDCKKLTALAADGISPKTTGIVTADRQVIRFMVSSLKIVAAGPCSVAPLRRLEATKLLATHPLLRATNELVVVRVEETE